MPPPDRRVTRIGRAGENAHLVGPPGDAVIPGRCPGCGAPRRLRFRPFCSAFCRDRDLIGWLDEAYAVPASDRPKGEGEDEES